MHFTCARRRTEHWYIKCILDNLHMICIKSLNCVCHVQILLLLAWLAEWTSEQVTDSEHVWDWVSNLCVIQFVQMSFTHFPWVFNFMCRIFTMYIWLYLYGILSVWSLIVSVAFTRSWLENFEPSSMDSIWAVDKIMAFHCSFITRRKQRPPWEKEERSWRSREEEMMDKDPEVGKEQTPIDRKLVLMFLIKWNS